MGLELLLTIILTSVGAFLPNAVAKGGAWSGGGGGEGVVCFANENEANEAAVMLEANSRLTPQSRAKIRSAYSLDYIQFARAGRATPARLNESPTEYLNRLLRDSSQAQVPYFHQRLLETVAKIESAIAKATPGVPLRLDAHQVNQLANDPNLLCSTLNKTGHSALYVGVGDLPRLRDGVTTQDVRAHLPKCVPVQLAIRCVRGNELTIFTDQKIHSLIAQNSEPGVAVASLAFFNLHEAIGMMTALLGATNSAGAQVVVGTLLSPEPNGKALEGQARVNAFIKFKNVLAAFGLSQYPDLFPVNKATEGTVTSLQSSHALLSRLDAEAGAAAARLAYGQSVLPVGALTQSNTLQYKIYLQAHREGLLTRLAPYDEAAFLQVTQVDPDLGFNPEQLLLDDRAQGISLSHLRNYCSRLIAKNQSLSIFQQAIRYCQRHF